MVKEMADAAVCDFVATYLPRIRRAFTPEHVIIFGSLARGESTPQSDIDLIVVARCFAREKFINRMGWFYREVQPRVHIDALCYTPEEFERRRRDSWVVEAACREGKWL